MATEMVIVGIILFAGIGLASIKMWMNRRSEKKEQDDVFNSESFGEHSYSKEENKK